MSGEAQAGAAPGTGVETGPEAAAPTTAATPPLLGPRALRRPLTPRRALSRPLTPPRALSLPLRRLRRAARDARGGVPVWAAIPLAAFLGLALLSYAMLGRDQDALPSALMDKPAPEFELPPLREGGEGLSTADLREPGVKLVNVWASWCGPCRVEHPELMELSRMGAVVHGLNYKDARADARGFLAEMGDPYARIGADPKGRAGIEWGVYGVPETFILDGEGRIVHKHVGPIQNDDLETKILPAMRAAGWSPEG